MGPVFPLLPAHLQHSVEQTGGRLANARCAWYSSDGEIKLPVSLEKTRLWVINGQLLPIVSWDAAHQAADEHQCDALFFGPPGSASASQYPESFVVDAAGKILRVERHYVDSPVFTNVYFGPACFLLAQGSRATSIVHHVIRKGWCLDSIRTLSQNAKIEWCVTPGVLSSLEGAVFAGRIEGRKSPSQNDANQGSDKGSNVRPLESNTEQKPPGNFVRDFTKRSMDIVLSSIFLFFLSPLFVATAVLIRFTSRGPVFFADRRQGLGGKEFSCFKFRTMIPEAASLQSKLRQENEVDGPQFKLSNDPRLTKVGDFLRKYNVDELPQLFNVLVGEMSLVGPRPSPDRENQLCPGWRRTRLSVRPGITGLWQVLRLRNSNTSDFQEWIYYDVEYAKHQSLWLDCLIILYTPCTVFAPRLVGRLAKKIAKRGICTGSERVHSGDTKDPPSMHRATEISSCDI